jgi:hypothetical protein
VTSHHTNDGEIGERVLQAMRECTHQVARFHGEDETLQALERLASTGHLYSIGAIEHGGEPHYVLAPRLR